MDNLWIDAGVGPQASGQLPLPIVGAVGLGIEASYWAEQQAGPLQRTADISARAAALTWILTGSREQARDAARTLASLNGFTGRHAVRVQQVQGVRVPADVAWQVNVFRSVRTVLSGLFINALTIPLAAQGTVEIFPPPQGQPPGPARPYRT